MPMPVSGIHSRTVYSTIKRFLTLAWHLLRQELHTRHAGTVLGWVWLLAAPVAMLGVYVLVFGEILQVRFGTRDDPVGYALSVLAGLGMFNALADVLVRSPSLLVEQRQLLLNSPVPAAVLPLVVVGNSVIVELLYVVLVLACAGWSSLFVWPALWLYPPLLLIRVMLSLAAAYTLAVLGVFLRDLKLLMSPLMSVLLLVSPVLYPLERVPQPWQDWLAWNPLAALVQAYRAALLEGVWAGPVWLLLLACALPVMAVWVFRQLQPQVRAVL